MPENALEHFRHLLPTGKLMLTIGDLATASGLSESGIQKHIDCGKICTHRFNSGSGRRFTVRIPYSGAVLFLLQTKEYSPADYLDGVIGLLRTLPRQSLEHINKMVPHLIERATRDEESLAGDRTNTRSHG